MTREVSPSRQWLEIPKPTAEIAAISQAIVGQEEAVESFAKMLASIRSGIRPIKPQPLDVKFLAGPSGVGKTEMVYRLAELLGADPSAREKVFKLNGGEYQSKAEVTRLIGSAPGYIGSEDSRFPGGTKPLLGQENLDAHRITFRDKRGRDRSVVIILVDEVESAHPALQRAFLSILDRGNLDLSNNTSVDFRDALIFLTSNVGNQQVEQLRATTQQEAKAQENIPEAFRATLGEAIAGMEAREVVEKVYKTAFPPEFRGRIKDLIIFGSLNEDAISKIVDLKMREVEDVFGQNDVPIKLELNAGARAWLVKNGYNPSEGARALEKLVKASITDQLTLAHGEVSLAHKTIYIEYNEGTQDLVFYFNETPDLFEVPAPKLSYEARKQLLDAIYCKREQEGGALAIQMAELKKAKNRLLESGEVPSAEVIRRDPEIQDIVKSNLIRKFKGSGIVTLITFFNAFADAGLIIDWDEVSAMPEIREIARDQLVAILAEKKTYDPSIAYLLQLSGAISRKKADELYKQLETTTQGSGS